MALSVRPPISSLPSYSLTGDLIAFQRCGLQYRLFAHRQLAIVAPSSAVVRAIYPRSTRRVVSSDARQWEAIATLAPGELDDIMDRIDRRLAAQNIRCWNDQSEQLGRSRATAAVNELGPLLFPLINQAEVRVRGARKLPAALKALVAKDIERYEMLGVIDIVTQVELRDPKSRGNKLLELVVEDLPTDPPDEFEVIVDYKGMKRPESSTKGASLWEIYEWQVHTYAHLRSLLTPKPIIAGVIIYLNELVPTKTDFYSLRKALVAKDKNVLLPEPGSDDEKTLRTWKPSAPGEEPPLLSFEYRLTRAIRVIPIDAASTTKSLDEFDQTVAKIEKCISDESSSGLVIASWDTNTSHEPTCEACDAKTFCPDYKKVKTPRLPGVSSKP